MKIILSESQVDQTILKFCEISFEEIKNMCENMFSYDSWPSYLSLNTCLDYGSISVIDFFNVRSSKNDKKIIGEKKYPKYFVDCRIYYSSAINMSEQSLYEITQSMTEFIFVKYKLYISINIDEYINTRIKEW
jgi:hypothetical protein